METLEDCLKDAVNQVIKSQKIMATQKTVIEEISKAERLDH